jgi:hypothetical protein
VRDVLVERVGAEASLIATNWRGVALEADEEEACVELPG